MTTELKRIVDSMNTALKEFSEALSKGTGSVDTAVFDDRFDDLARRMDRLETDGCDIDIDEVARNLRRETSFVDDIIEDLDVNDIAKKVKDELDIEADISASLDEKLDDDVVIENLVKKLNGSDAFEGMVKTVVKEAISSFLNEARTETIRALVREEVRSIMLKVVAQ